MAPVKKPIDYMKQIPPRQAFEELAVGMETYRKHKEVEHLIKELHSGMSLYDKTFVAMMKEIEEQAKHPDTSASNHADLKQVTSRFEKSLETFKSYMTREGLGKDLKDAENKYKTNEALAEKLVELASHSKIAVIKVLGADLEKDAKAFKAASERVAEGGHPFFDKETAKAGRELWLMLDHAYDEYGFQLKRDGIEYDPIYARRPTQLSPLRPRLSAVDPNAKVPSAKAKSKAADGSAASTGKKTVKKKDAASTQAPTGSSDAANSKTGDSSETTPTLDASKSDGKRSK